MSLSTLLVILLVVILFGGGGWGWANRESYGPAPLGVVGVLVIVLLFFLLTGHRF